MISAYISWNISVEALEVQSILYNCAYLYLVFPLGLMYACSTFVGCFIGQGNITKAVDYVKIILIISFTLQAFLFLSVIVFAQEITNIFINDENLNPLVYGSI